MLPIKGEYIYVSTPEIIPQETTKEVTKDDVLVMIEEEFGGEMAVMKHVAYCESGLRQHTGGAVLRGVVNPQDIGLFQINADYHEEKAIELGYDIYTISGNIAMAGYLLDTQGLNAWIHSRYCWLAMK